MDTTTQTTLEQYNKMLSALERIQHLYLDLGYMPLAIKANWIYNQYKEGLMEHDKAWDWRAYLLNCDNRE